MRWPWLLALLLAAGCGGSPSGAARAEKPAKIGGGALTARGARTCRLIDGRAYCWGSNAQGALRPDAPPALRVPVAAPFETPAAEVLPLEAATCIRTHEGAVECVGIHPRSILETEALTDVVALEGGRGYACAVHADGRVSCWGVGAPGSNRRHERFEIEGLDDAVQLAAGAAHMCALKRDRTIACWGDNRHGQLGDGSDRSHDTPGPVAYQGDDVAEIAAGAFHACLRTTEGRVHCWGRDHIGQVDGGDELSRLEPTPVPDLPAAGAIAAGGDTTCASTAEGVYCWGNGACGQRGVTPPPGCSQRRSTAGDRGPRRVLDGPVDELAVGQLHVCARRGGEVLCWGGDDAGQLGRGAQDGTTRGGSCHPRAGLCASEEPAPVLPSVDDPTSVPLGEGIAWEAPMAFAQAPRPPPHEVRFEVLEAEGHAPEALARILTLSMRDPVLSCYRRLGQEPPARVLEATVQENGDEIPEVSVEDLAEPLARCFRATLARGYYSVAGEGSFRLRATFTPDGWDGQI